MSALTNHQGDHGSPLVEWDNGHGVRERARLGSSPALLPSGQRPLRDFEVDFLAVTPGSAYSLEAKVPPRTSLRSIFGDVPHALASFVRVSGPVQFFARSKDRWQLAEEDACKLLGLDPRDRAGLKEILEGINPAKGRDIQDRLRALLLIRKLLAGLYNNDPAAERAWLVRPSEKLGDETPLHRMTEGGMEGLLFVRDYLRWHSGY